MRNTELEGARMDTHADSNGAATAPTVAPEPDVIDGHWGYACLHGDAVYIPVIAADDEWSMGRILRHIYEASGRRTRFIFSAVLHPDEFRTHLRNIVREWEEYVPEFEDVSYCIEITYEPSDSR